MKQFLLEVGTEELPPALVAPAAAELGRRVAALLADNSVPAGEVETFATPRRLAVRINGVAPEKPAGVVELQGPPRKAAFDVSGTPTKTAVGFARAHGKTPADLHVRKTDKGEYAFLQKDVPAVPTAVLLAQGLPDAVASLPFPRTMRWLDDKTRFPRPVRWLVGLLDDDVVPFEFAGLQAGSLTFGHRSRPGPARLTRPLDYERVLKERSVIASPAARRAATEAGLKARAAEVGGVLLDDPELLDETVNITEWPEPILCSFSPDYLSLPVPLLVTALKKHQRCFSVQGKDGLLPGFIAVANTPGCDHAQVRAWYEKAVDSRLKDAKFFYDADLKLGIEPLVEEEKRVTWVEGMGTLYDKTERLRKLCAYLASVVPDVDKAALDRAALLCKADLLTQVIREKEFTSLQGIMGGIYARSLGEPAEACQAIADHYLPRFIGDRLPETPAACLLSIADKMDNIVAAFVAGSIPTGSEDPFALRRQAAGILAVILERTLPVDVSDLLSSAAGLFPGAAPGTLPDFFRERMAALLADKGIRYDVAAGVLATNWHTPAEALARARALTAYRSQPDFERLIIGQKRVANILKGLTVEGPPDQALFAEPTEELLWTEAVKAGPDLGRALAAADYAAAFGLLLALRPVIDKFFDDVLVMDKDPAVRDNRLRLVLHVRSLFLKVADLSQIVLEGGTAEATE